MSKIIKLAQSLHLVPDANSVPFNPDSILLTEEETKKAIEIALMAKRSAEYTRVYNETILRSTIIPQLSTDQLLALVKERGKTEIPDFSLTADQENTYKLIAQYFAGDPAFEAEGYSHRKGLMLFGSVGCGKTTIMRMFSYNQKASFVIKSCRKIAGDYAEHGEEILGQYAGRYYPTMIENPFKTENWGICFDDLGTEDVRSHYKNQMNVMERILLDRYDRIREIPHRTHVTTNLDGNQISEFYGKRVASRMREMFNIIEVDGGDLRK